MGRSVYLIITGIVLLGLSQISAETQTQLNITNSPPVLLQNIPDILVILDTPKINAFDLDDYFEDANGDILMFTHSPINNVTVTINSENQVSFYPDINYSGTQLMQFNASDAEGTAVSNMFQLKTGLDITPPQWSNPKKNRPSVYQNYHVTFTAAWTDNVGLKEFIFSINQGLGWQNQTVTPFSGTSNTSSFKIQISAAANTQISWTFYAKDIYENTNKVDTQTFTVKEFIIKSGEEYEGGIDYSGDQSEDSESAVGGISYGTDGAEMDYFKEGVLAKNLEVDIRSIKASMKQGSNMTKVVQIINTGNVEIEITASLKNMGLFAQLGETSFKIAPGETYELLIEFTIPKNTMPDQYFGFLLLDYGDQISIPIVVDVKKFESEVMINVTLSEKYKAVRVEEEVTALITIKNLKDIQSSSSQLYYALKDFNGHIIESANEEIILPSLFEEEKTLIVPEGTPDGEYIFYARIVSEDSIDLDSDTLLIGVKFKILAILKKFLYPVTILILLLILLILYRIYKRNKKKKRLLELYLLLNELRGLVKDDKTIQAMDIYKRIKLTYGQHVSKGFMENEVKLREELKKFSETLKKTSDIKESPEEKPKEIQREETKQDSKEKQKETPEETPEKNQKEKPEQDSKQKEVPKEKPKQEKPKSPKLNSTKDK